MKESIEVRAKIDALLVAAGKWVKITDLARVLRLADEEMEEALRDYENELLAADRGTQLHRKSGAVRIEIKAPHVPLLYELFPDRRPRPTRDQSNEVLAIIAHCQPISVQGISEFREIDSESVIRSLAARGWIQSLKKRGSRGERLWKVTQQFLEAHGLNSVAEIRQPAIRDRVFPGLVQRRADSSEEAVN